MTLKERLGLSDRDILAKTIQAEAGNQGAQGMLAVGSVIMNRTKASGYGGSIQDVILKPGQFSPWNSETNYAGGAQGQDMMNLVASPQAYAVTDAVLSGKAPDPTSGATHFYNPDISNPSWGAEKQGGDWTRINSHLFGKADAGRSSNQIIADGAMRAIGKQPIGLADANIKENSQMMQQRRPRGLLENFGIQKMQEGAEGETGQRFYNRDTFKDKLADLAVGFGKMGIMGLDEPAAAVANRRAARRDKNKTIEAIGKMGTPQSEQAIAFLNAGGDPVSALKIAFAKPDGKYRQVLGSSIGLKGADATRLFNVSPDGKYSSVGSGPSTVINTGDVGTGEYGYGAKFGLKSGERINLKTGKISVIPGSSLEREMTKAEQSSERIKTQVEDQTSTTGSVIDKKVDMLVKMLETDGTFNLPEAGILGGALGKMGINQEAVTFANEIQAIQSIIAFDQLAKMRAASKTGAALGAVTERELDLLMSAYGSLKTNTDPKILAQNLKDIKRVMGLIEREPAAREIYYGGGGSTSSSSQSGIVVGEPING